MTSDEQNKPDNQDSPKVLDHEEHDLDEDSSEADSSNKPNIDEEVSRIEDKPIVDITEISEQDDESHDDDLLPAALTPKSDDKEEPHIEAELEEEEEKPRRAKSKSTAATALLEELTNISEDIEEKLRSQLTGTILINLTDKNLFYLFNWKDTKLKIEKTSKKTADCSIEINEANLLQIARDELNPQVAMLSDKIKVDGNVSLALYFFNLIAPA